MWRFEQNSGMSDQFSSPVLSSLREDKSVGTQCNDNFSDMNINSEAQRLLQHAYYSEEEDANVRRSPNPTSFTS